MTKDRDELDERLKAFMALSIAYLCGYAHCSVSGDEPHCTGQTAPGPDEPRVGV